MSKREIDSLMAAIPGQVKAAHASIKDVNTKNTAEEATGSFGYEGNVVTCPSDYGFDMFGETGPEYIKARSKEIARQSLEVHGKPSSGADHSTKDDTAPLKGGKEVKTVETTGILDGEDEKFSEVDVSRKFGNPQGAN